MNLNFKKDLIISISHEFSKLLTFASIFGICRISFKAKKLIFKELCLLVNLVH